jgi:hypothetical protein
MRGYDFREGQVERKNGMPLRIIEQNLSILTRFRLEHLIRKNRLLARARRRCHTE